MAASTSKTLKVALCQLLVTTVSGLAPLLSYHLQE